MKTDYSYEKIIKDVSRLENLIETCCDDVKEYKFTPASFSYSSHIADEKLIGIDETLLAEVENLIKYDKKYLSALKMTVYHEIGHDKIYGKSKDHDFNEAVAELYAINKGTLEDYIIEIATISELEKDKLSSFNQTLGESRNAIDYLLKHDGADKWTDPEFISKASIYGFTKNALNKVDLPYTELVYRVLQERENIDSLKGKNNLFIDKGMITSK